MQETSYHSFSLARSEIEKRSKKILDILSGMMFTCAILRDSMCLIAHLHAAALPFDRSAYRASSAPALTAGCKSLCCFALSEAHRLGFAREALLFEKTQERSESA